MKIAFNLIDVDQKEDTMYNIAYHAQLNGVKFTCHTWSEGALFPGIYISPDSEGDVVNEDNDLKFIGGLAKDVPGVKITLQDIAGNDRSVLCPKKGENVLIFFGEGNPTEVAYKDVDYANKVSDNLQYI